MVFIAPTVITKGSLPGARMVPHPLMPCVLFRPSFPAATTTTMPAFHACSTAWHREVQLIALVNRSAEREADHTDVVLRFEAEDLLNGRDHTTVRTVAVLAQYTKVDEVHARRNAAEGMEIDRSSRAGTVAADNARYGLAVTIMIVGAAANEILTIHDP